MTYLLHTSLHTSLAVYPVCLSGVLFLIWHRYLRWFQPQWYSNASQICWWFLSLNCMARFSLMPAHILACWTPLPGCPPATSNSANHHLCPSIHYYFLTWWGHIHPGLHVEFSISHRSHLISPGKILPTPSLSSILFLFCPSPGPNLVLYHLLTRFF